SCASTGPRRPRWTGRGCLPKPSVSVDEAFIAAHMALPGDRRPLSQQEILMSLSKIVVMAATAVLSPVLIAACAPTAPTPTEGHAPLDTPAATATATPATPVVPALGSSRFWKKTAAGKIIVTTDNFIRAESDV